MNFKPCDGCQRVGWCEHKGACLMSNSDKLDEIVDRHYGQGFDTETGSYTAMSDCRAMVEEAFELGQKSVGTPPEARFWQPMESAPKDGTYILAIRHGHIRQAKWCADVFGKMRWGNDGWWYPDEDQPSGWIPMPQLPQRDSE